ncbi:hypothetical protein CCHL11_10183 [Colletotrichum chlorophyti]|uniref:Uncharacterized protein n=1 Tax=Colletotrichum chlorophyti TaxID=708187 RepID=A0A1Q8RD58_9PEZI|nr:hypothetical protein CCHL11_10183 [Colletotrichum chlorophyti]
MVPLSLLQKGSAEKSTEEPQGSVLDRKRPVPRWPDSFSANLGRKPSSSFNHEDPETSTTEKSIPQVPSTRSSLPESRSIIHRKRDVVAGCPPGSRARQTSASSVKAMVAKFEGAAEHTPEKSDRMTDNGDHTPSSSFADKGKVKASADSSYNDTTVASLPLGQASKPEEDPRSVAEELDLEFLKMQELYKGVPLSRCLDNDVPPKRNNEKVKVLPLEEDEGKSMLKAAQIELQNQLAAFHEAFEKRHPLAKRERLEKEAAEALKSLNASKQPAQKEAVVTSTKASRRADKKAQKKADKKARKASKREAPVANAPHSASSSAPQQPVSRGLSLRDKYPETFAKIDYWRSLPDPDKPGASSNGASAAKSAEDYLQSVENYLQSPLPVVQPATRKSSIPDKKHDALKKAEYYAFNSDESTEVGESSDTLSEYEYVSEPAQSASQPSAPKPATQETPAEDSFTFIQRDPEEVATALHISDSELSDSESVKEAKDLARRKEKEEINRRAHDRVNAAHAEGHILSLENTKPIRDAFATGIKKSDIVPGFGGDKKNAAPEFDEEAYAARSIASHTLRPAPLRIPSRTKPLAATGDTAATDTEGSAQPAAQPSSARSVGPEYKGRGTRVASGNYKVLGHESKDSGARKTSACSQRSGAVNFSWPKHHDVHGQPDVEGTSSQAPGKRSPAMAVHYSDPNRPLSGAEKLAELFNSTSSAGSVASQRASSTVRSTSSTKTTAAAVEDTQTRQSFTADEYQAMIQDYYDDFTRDSPEKRKLTNTTTPTNTFSNITHQTARVTQQAPVHLQGTTPFPPTPRHDRPFTTVEKMAILDDFFNEENDQLYKTFGPLTSASATAAGPATGPQPWDDSSFHEEALSHGYAYQGTNYNPLPVDLDPVPLTPTQRRQTLASYGMSEADYPAPPASYPNPPGPEHGSVAPPCPTRRPPAIPGVGDSTTSRSNTDEARVQSLRRHRRLHRAATAPPRSPAPGYDADWF